MQTKKKKKLRYPFRGRKSVYFIGKTKGKNVAGGKSFEWNPEIVAFYIIKEEKIKGLKKKNQYHECLARHSPDFPLFHSIKQQNTAFRVHIHSADEDVKCAYNM